MSNPVPDPAPTPLPLPVQTAPGASTSEYALTKALVVVGVVLQAFAGALGSLPADLASARWVAVASLACGTALQVLAGLGYVRSRTDVKVAQAAGVRPPGP